MKKPTAKNHIAVGRKIDPWRYASVPVMEKLISFQNTQKILRENLRFPRNSESMREFFTNILMSIFFNWGFFWPWSSSFKITNHFCIWLWIDLAEGNCQNQIKEFYIWGICPSLFFLISCFNFLLLLLFICDITCLFRFRLSLFTI